jgi:hypothetical protein
MTMDPKFKWRLLPLLAGVVALLASICQLSAATISGTVKSESTGALLENIVVELYQGNEGEWIFLGQTQTSIQGIYQHEDLPDGTYLVHFRGGSSYVDEYYNDAPDMDTATGVVIEGGINQTGIDASLLPSLGSISGTVTGPDRVTPLAGIHVVLYYGYYGSDGQWYGPNHVWTYTGADGSYRFDNLGETVVYRVGFFDESNRYGTQYYQNASGVRLATDVMVSAGQETTGINASLMSFGFAWPEIVVEESEGLGLTDGEALVSFGDAAPGAPVTKTLVLRNIGAADLTGLAVTLRGTDAADFAVGAPGAITLAPGENTSFTVTFTPSEEGPRSAALEIASNDADENPFDIVLEGNGLPPPSPEMAVEEPEGTELEDGISTLAFGESVVGVPVTKTVTIRNTGTADLTDLAVTLSGANESEFAVGAPGLTTLPPGERTTFTVTFTSTAEGARSAALAIASNDADENPFDISLTGAGLVVLASDIQVEHPPGTQLENASAFVAFGNSLIGAPVTKTIIVRNTGEAALTGLAVAIVGMNASEFTVSGLGAYRLAPGAHTSFTVTYEPTVGGYGIASLQITSNDADENPFSIVLTGIGVFPTAPEIVVEHPVGSRLLDGASSLAFGSSMVGAPITKTVTVRNTGGIALNGLAVTSRGMDASEFTLSGLGATSLAPGAATTFTVTFKPVAAGTRRASIHIASNDADENPFDITMTGVGKMPTAPEITVRQGEGSKKELKNNKSRRDFGVIEVGTLSEEMVFTIKNDGTAPLKKLKVTITGKQAREFELIIKPIRSVAPGKSTKFKVAYRPGRAKTSRATLEIASNDKDETPFRVKITGTGTK